MAGESAIISPLPLENVSKPHSRLLRLVLSVQSVHYKYVIRKVFIVNEISLKNYGHLCWVLTYWYVLIIVAGRVVIGHAHLAVWKRFRRL